MSYQPPAAFVQIEEGHDDIVSQHCNVCLSQLFDPEDGIVSVGGSSYHTTCANLWVNRIFERLPT